MNVAEAAIAADASISVNGAKLELIDRGRGRPILFLHPHIGIAPSAPVLALLADGGRLVAPSHPGFGRSELPPALTTVDDLAYFYLDAMEELDLEQALVVGVSFGAWIAAAIAVKSTARMSRLVLANPVGIKVGDRESRDILDIFAMTEPEFLEKAFADTAAAQRDYRAMSEEELRIVARNAEVDGALRLVALHARPQAQAPPAPHPHSDAGAVGHRRQADRRELWPRLRRRDPGREVRGRRRRGPLSPSRTAEAVRRAGARLRRAQFPLLSPYRVPAMRVYQFTEQPYFPAWTDHAGSLRVNLPNAKQDPAVAADLLHRYYDEWRLADELGLDIMVNEHHATATCMSATAIVALSVLARETKRARLLVLGYPIGHRPDPLRAAEELATIDVISRGRLDMGFIKGVPYEFPVSNQNPVGTMDRFWEAHDFILKAMTSHDVPFNWESETLPLPARQSVAAALPGAASAGVEHHRQPHQCPHPW